jgi:hypothetical protein
MRCGTRFVDLTIEIESKSLQTGTGTGLKPGHYEEKRPPWKAAATTAMDGAAICR